MQILATVGRTDTMD